MVFHGGELLKQSPVFGVCLQLCCFPIESAAVFLDANGQVEHFVCIESVAHCVLLF